MRVGKWHYLIWGTLFLLIVGVILHVQQLFIMTAAVGLLAPISYLLSSRALGRVKVRRDIPGRMTAGQLAEIRLTVHNTSSQRRTSLSIGEALPDGLSALDGHEQLIMDLGPGEQRTVTGRLLALRRGVYELSELRLITSDLIGLFEFAEVVADPHQLLVYPKALPLRNMWPTGAAPRHLPQASRRRPGQGSDFYGVREYVPGDDLRRIHWKVTAHRGKLSVSEGEHPQSLAATVIIDLSANVHAGEGSESSLEYGVTLAASLLAQALTQERAADLIARGQTDYSVTGSGQPGQRIRLLEALARVSADGSRPLEAVAAEKRLRLAPAGSVAVISPQVGDEMREFLDMLQEWGNVVSWFSLVAPSFEGRTDSEVHYQSFMAALRARGCRAYLIRGDTSLEASLGRGERRAG